MTTKVAVIVGSLRKASVNRLFAQALAKVARPKLDLQIVEIGDLPLGQSLSDLQRNALMENLARVIRITCVSGQAASIHQQAQLRRFTFLPAECPEGAGAYRAILLRLRVELPHWMT